MESINDDDIDNKKDSNNYKDSQKDDDIDNKKDNVNYKEEDGIDLERQRQWTVVVMERDRGQGAQNCSHYNQHASLLSKM